MINENGDEQSSQVFLSTENGFGFIQTDKPIYTPKETVKIRMMRLDDNLRPISEAIKLQIKNPSNITMDEIIFPSTTSKDNFIIDYEFKIPPDPIKNTWQAIMFYGASFTIQTNITFKVDEYVLPPFKVILQSPIFISPSSKTINGSVQAYYLNNNKPVSGSARFIFKVKIGDDLIPVGQTRDQVLIDGKKEYLFSIQEFKEVNTWFPEVNGSRLIVEVIIVEISSGRKVKRIDDSTRFVNHPYLISFDNSFKQFYLEQENKLTGEIFDINHEPASGIPVIMTVYEKNKPSKSVQTISDQFGRVEMLYKPAKSSSSITYQIATKVIGLTDHEQVAVNHTLTRYKVKSGSLTIENRQDRFKVGQKYTSKISFEGSTFIFSHIYYTLLIKGKIASFAKLPDDDVLSFDIEASMRPHFRLVLFSYRQDRIVSDSLLITVDDANAGGNSVNCNLNVSYRDSKNVSRETLKPGDSGTLIVTSLPKSQVAIQAIDEAVYLLQSKQILTKQKLIKITRQKDQGCGPGGGLNSTDVILNAGLIIIGIDSSKHGSLCKLPDEHKSILTRLPRSSSARHYAIIDKSYVKNLDDPNHHHDPCCKHGYTHDNQNRSCVKRWNILLLHLRKYAKCGSKCNEHFCAKLFLKCCTEAHPQTKHLAVAGMTSSSINNDISRIFTPKVTIEQEAEMEESTLTRDDFRETWLFDIIYINQSGINYYPIIAPHSITSWAIDALSLSRDGGLCLMSKPFRIKTTQELYMRVDLPYSVVQDEQVEMLINLFNYSPIDLSVTLYVYGPEGVCSQTDSGEKTARRFIQLQSGLSHSESFALLPLKVGEFDIKIVALSANMSDVVVKKILVVPRGEFISFIKIISFFFSFCNHNNQILLGPGIEVNDEYRIQLDPQNRQRRSKRLVTDKNLIDSINPEKGEQKTTIHLNPGAQTIVPESEECIISAIADRYGPTIETSLKDLNHLIRKPSGCGEQNVIYMAPTLFTLDYLNLTQKLSPEQLKKGINFLKEGYKQQLMFRNQIDGLFSAFKGRKTSIWLTSFVMRIFCLSTPYINVDYEVVYSAINQIIANQRDDGSWLESNSLLHKKAMGGIRGIVPNTAFILISLRTCENRFNNLSNSAKIVSAIRLAEGFLCSQVNKSVVNAYTTALVAHSLSKSTCLTRRMRHQLLTDLTGLSLLDLDSNRRSWLTEPITETAGYALMAYLTDKNNWRDELQSTVNYLESIRTFSGSFDATQDTIVALEALSKYARLYQSLDDINLVCNIDAGNFHKRIKFNEQNAQVMQTFDVQKDANNIDIYTNGTGIGSLQIRYKYNILEPKEKLCGIELNITISDYATANRNVEEEFDFDAFFTTEVTEQLGTTRTIENSYPDSNLKDSNYQLQQPNQDGHLLPFDGHSTLTSTKQQQSSDSESKKIDKISVCVRNYGHSFEDNSMAIVEVGILSGYVVDDQDLEQIIKLKGSLVSKYEKTTRSVIFYLESLPQRNKPPYCISFKITQQTVISNLQSALVKAYHYYSKGRCLYS